MQHKQIGAYLTEQQQAFALFLSKQDPKCARNGIGSIAHGIRVALCEAAEKRGKTLFVGDMSKGGRKIGSKNKVKMV
jgi:hypothetical protein